MGIGRSTAWVAWMLVATACGEELVASGESRARQELKHHHKHPKDAGTPSTDAGVPNCGLPVDAFRANWRAVTPGHKDTGLSLGKASPRLFDLLDVLDANGTPTGFPSLQGLTPTKKRMCPLYERWSKSAFPVRLFIAQAAAIQAA